MPRVTHLYFYAFIFLCLLLILGCRSTGVIQNLTDCQDFTLPGKHLNCEITYPDKINNIRVRYSINNEDEYTTYHSDLYLFIQSDTISLTWFKTQNFVLINTGNGLPKNMDLDYSPQKLLCLAQEKCESCNWKRSNRRYALIRPDGLNRAIVDVDSQCKLAQIILFDEVNGRDVYRNINFFNTRESKLWFKTELDIRLLLQLIRNHQDHDLTLLFPECSIYFTK